jgi:hypothetical protein
MGREMTKKAEVNKEIWMPGGVLTPKDLPQSGNVHVVIVGPPGSGKSHCVNQLLYDQDYGPDEVYVIMAENSITTYRHPDVRFTQVTTFTSANERRVEMVRAGQDGARLPKVAITDSLSGICDKQMEYYKDVEPFVSGKSGNRDKLAEYGDLGEQAIAYVGAWRDQLYCDVVTLVTSFEGAHTAVPELAVPGKVIPKNLTRLSSVCLYLRPVPFKCQPGEVPAEIPKHITVDQNNPNEDGSFNGVKRLFITMNTGEFEAKGHHALDLIEPGYLPDVLRKIHAG